MAQAVLITGGVGHRRKLPAAGWAIVLALVAVVIVASVAVARQFDADPAGAAAGLAASVAGIALIVGAVLYPQVRRVRSVGRRLWLSPPATCWTAGGALSLCDGRSEVRLVVTPKQLLLVPVRGSTQGHAVKLAAVRQIEIINGVGSTRVEVESEVGELVVTVGQDVVLRRQDLWPSFVRTLIGLGVRCSEHP